MDLLIVLKVAVRNLRRTLVRSSLTTLGIIIGVAAVIVMVSIGNGARAEIETSLARLDANQLTITAAMPHERRHFGRPAPMPVGDGVTLEDYAAIRSEIDGISLASVLIFAPTDLSTNGRSTSASIYGVDVVGFQISSRTLVRGSTFGEADVHGSANVCVISESIAQNLLAESNPVGRFVRVQDVPFFVIGVMADDDAYRNLSQPWLGDTSVFMPYTSVLRRLDRAAPISVVLKADNPGNLDQIQQQVGDLLERRRGKRKAEFITGNVDEALRMYREGSQTMTLLLGAIGGISLLVGGIGIMNIMLVSVTERTREIGIRMAIGTRSKDVLRQFLIEAVILSVFGGVIGIALGVGAAQIVTHFNDWPTRVTPASVLAAFACSAAIGIFFGYYPARQAAQLDPIEALRSD